MSELFCLNFQGDRVLLATLTIPRFSDYINFNTVSEKKDLGRENTGIMEAHALV